MRKRRKRRRHKQRRPKFQNDQLDSLVAPIALYPDPLLAQMLAASTYPLEIIQLQQWLAKHKDLKDKALVDAVQKENWDPSVQGMAALPDAVKQLAENIKWTTDLGNAFLAQQSDVMDAVQRMRSKAQGAGTLKSTEQQKVEKKVVENKTVVVIEQANPQVIYVPSYNPTVVYGPPVYPYPPIVYPPPPSTGAVIATAAISFGVGMAMGAAWGGGWGYHAGWGHNDVNINVNNQLRQQLQQEHERQHGHKRQQPGECLQQQLAAQLATPRRRSLFKSGDGEQIWRHHSRGIGGTRQANARQNVGAADNNSLAARIVAVRPTGRQAAWIAVALPPGNNRAQPIAAAGIASVTVASRAEVPPAAAVEPSAAVEAAIAEAAREPAVPAERPAWVPAEAEAAATGAAAGEVAAGGGGRQAMIGYTHMRSNRFCAFPSDVLLAAQVTVLSCALSTLVHAAPQTKPTSAADSAQMSFATPQLAAEALVKAAGDFDVPALLNILGPDGRDLVSSADAVQDKSAAAEFAAKAKEKQAVLIDPKNSKRAILSIGGEDWPVPIPLVQKKGKWYFDTKAGLEETLFRRIGENELDAIAICRGFVEAQNEYAQSIHDNSGVNQYAQKIISTPGKQDGLAWRNPDGTLGRSRRRNSSERTRRGLRG